MMRLLVAAVLYLLAGAACSVVVAWGCSLYVDRPVTQARWVTAEPVTAWPAAVDPAWPQAPRVVTSGETRAYSIRGGRTFGRRRQGGRMRPVVAYQVELHRIGWPVPCLGWELRETPTGVEHHRGLGLPRWLELTARSSGRRLPYALLWPGFAIDTASFALLAWIGVGAPLAAQRFVRGWRGCCASCGYDLRGTGGDCPECGGR